MSKSPKFSFPPISVGANNIPNVDSPKNLTRIHPSVVLVCNRSNNPVGTVGATLALIWTFGLWPHNLALELVHSFFPFYLISGKSFGKYVVTLLLNTAIYYLYLLSQCSVTMLAFVKTSAKA